MYVGRASNRWRTHTSVHVVPLFVGKKEPKGGEGHLVLVPHEGEDWWVRTDEESGPKRWRPPAALFVPPTRQSSAVATAARAAAQKKKSARRARAAGHAHACMGFFSPVRLCPHSPLSSHIRTYGRSISAASIQTVPNIIDQRASLPRTYVRTVYIGVLLRKETQPMHIMWMLSCQLDSGAW